MCINKNKIFGQIWIQNISGLACLLAGQFLFDQLEVYKNFSKKQMQQFFAQLSQKLLLIILHKKQQQIMQMTLINNLKFQLQCDCINYKCRIQAFIIYLSVCRYVFFLSFYD
ncbi:hypothetical protein ABPG72_019320 [Tetrahymena utriculariae]